MGGRSGVLLGGTVDARCVSPRLWFRPLVRWAGLRPDLSNSRGFWARTERLWGKERWSITDVPNLVVNEGLQHILDILFNSDDSAIIPIDPWYVGLVDGVVSSSTYAAGDTLASHAGWTENTNYADNRKEYIGVRSSQQVTNTASKASFAINADSQTIAGAFFASVATGTGGVLLSAVDFTGGEKNADDGDTLEVTYTFSAADDGA